MTEIRTAEELADIQNDLNGNYILKSDIDLAGIDWQPLGEGGLGHSFNGMFVNPYGHVIKNLRVSSSANINASGLFLGIHEALVDGIILKDIYINRSELPNSSAGGLALWIWNS